MSDLVPTTAADVRDQHWLDLQIDKIKESVADAGDRLQDIAANWTDNRNLSRLHPGVAAKTYVLDRLGVLGPAVIVPLLESTNWSNRQIAEIAGVSHDTVNRAARELDEIVQLDRPTETLGADGKLRPGRVVRVTTAEVIEPEADAPLDLDTVTPEEEQTMTSPSQGSASSPSETEPWSEDQLSGRGEAVTSAGRAQPVHS